MPDQNLSLALAVKKRLGGKYTERANPIGQEDEEPKQAFRRSPSEIVAAIQAKRAELQGQAALEPELPVSEDDHFDEGLPELPTEVDPAFERKEMLSRIMQGLGRE